VKRLIAPLGTRAARGFMLLEALLAVAIFAIGVLTLGRCISNGVGAERYKMEDGRARLVLQNRYEEIEGRAADLKNSTEKLEAPYEGLTLKQNVVPLHKRDEHGRELDKMAVVTLTVEWTSDATTESRSIVFYATVP
jgi:hypothetical protein